MDIFRNAIRRIIWLFAKRPAHFYARGYFVPVLHEDTGCTTFTNWDEYSDRYVDIEEKRWA